MPREIFELIFYVSFKFYVFGCKIYSAILLYELKMRVINPLYLEYIKFNFAYLDHQRHSVIQEVSIRENASS